MGRFVVFVESSWAWKRQEIDAYSGKLLINLAFSMEMMENHQNHKMNGGFWVGGVMLGHREPDDSINLKIWLRFWFCASGFPPLLQKTTSASKGRYNSGAQTQGKSFSLWIKNQNCRCITYYRINCFCLKHHNENTIYMFFFLILVNIVLM